MADISVEDAKLREELSSFGETVGKINDKTRPILIKKLNHLKARQKAAERPPSPGRRKTTPRKTTVALSARNSSSDEDEDVVDESNRFNQSVSSVGRNLRRRTIDVGPVSNLNDGESRTSRGLRSGRRSIGSANPDSPFMAGSLRKPVGSSPSRQLSDGNPAGDLFSSPVKRRDNDLEDHFSDDEYTFREMASTGVNTTQSLETSQNADFPSCGDLGRRQTSIPGKVSSSQHSGNNWLHKSGSVFLSLRWHTISQLLLGCVVMFFALVVLLYIFAVTSRTQLADLDNFSYCPSSDCTTNEMQDLKKTVIRIAEILSKQAGDVECAQTLSFRGMRLETLTSKLKSLYGTHENVDKALELLSKFSEESGIKLLDSKKKVTNKTDEVRYLESVGADKSLWCRLSTAIQRIFSYIVLSIIVILCGLVLIFLTIRWKKTKDAETKEVNQLVQDIVVLLKNHASSCRLNPTLLPYIALPHVRDAILPVADRARKHKLWEKAVRLISLNESRVREEVQTIDGEECNVWRWIDTFPAYPEGVTVSAARSQEAISSSPAIKVKSPCLRICNMIDISERDYSESAIYDAVLDRCGPHAGVLHIGISSSTVDGVYIKFVSESAAVQACKLLHGWMYKGRLTSVKEVGPVMYRALFPESTSAMVPLRSSNRRLSQSFSMAGKG